MLYSRDMFETKRNSSNSKMMNISYFKHSYNIIVILGSSSSSQKERERENGK